MSTLISTRFILTHLLIVGLVLTFANHVAPANGVKTRASVMVDVTSESHQAIIKSYLHRSLRGLDDVKICDDVNLDLDIATFGISVMHMQRESGVHILSSVIQAFMSPSNLSSNARALLKGASSSWSWTHNPCIVWQHQLHSGGTGISDLNTHCEQIIAAFDAETLEAWRLRQANH